jgi:galactokinase
MTPETLAHTFEKLYGAQPKVFRAPGRVNLIGEHTDYNDGFVMPCAIGLSTQVAVAPLAESRLVLRSEEFSQPFEFDTEHLPDHRLEEWCDYVLGVASMLKQAGYPIRGAAMLIRGEVPVGSGLSSSAAVEVASALALMSLSGTQLPLPEVAKLCQRAENTFIGARVGIMDQFVSCLGKAGHALLLDCRSLQFELVPIADEVRLVICNTMVKHQHAGGEYNRRREECEQGVKILSAFYPGIRALRDVSVIQLEEHAKDLPNTVYKRCLHVVRENQRVLDGAKCLQDGNLRGFGALMRQSHSSLRELYEVSCRELDLMVELAEALPGYCGGRMTGGGFGGCTVNLVTEAEAGEFADRISSTYQKATGMNPDVYICSAVDGAGVGLTASPVAG